MKKILIVCMVLVLFVPVASGASFAKNEDVSNNDRDLTEQNDPKNAKEILAKFGEGYRGNDNPSRFVNTTDTFFNRAGDTSVTFAFEQPNSGSEDRTIFDVSGESTTVLSIRTSESFFSIELNNLLQVSEQWPDWVEQGDGLSGFVQIDDGPLVDDTDIVTKVFASNGTLAIDTSVSNVGDPGTADNYIGTHIVGANGVGSDINVYEVRYFSEAVEDATLREIADPTESGFDTAREGSEEALWFLEEVTLGEIESQTPGDIVFIHNNDVNTNRSFTIKAWVLAQNHETVDPDNMINLSITTKKDRKILYYNTTNDTLQEEPFRFKMVEEIGSPFFFVKDITIKEKGHYVIYANATQNDFNVTGETKINVGDNVVEIAGMVSGDLVYLGAFAFLFLWSIFEGWEAPAVFSFLALNDPVWESVGVDYPFNFQTWVVIVAAAFLIQWLVARFGSLKNTTSPYGP